MGTEPPLSPTPIGYFPKRFVPPPAWMSDRGIEEVASVALCIADGPDGWRAQSKHNEWGLFPDPGTAWATVPADRRADFRLYAYKLHPLRFVDGNEEPMPLPELRVMPIGPDFRLIGWDVVSRSAGQHFECSPLSCNLLAEELVTNRYGLFADLNGAMGLALTAHERRCEPGPYHVVEVWRRGA